MKPAPDVLCLVEGGGGGRSYRDVRVSNAIGF